MLSASGYISGDYDKHAIRNAIRRYCTDYGYTEFMRKINQYTAGF